MKLRSFLFYVAGVVGVMVIMTDDRIGRWAVPPKPVVVGEAVDTCPAGIHPILARHRAAREHLQAGEFARALQDIAVARILPCDIDVMVRDHQADAWVKVATVIGGDGHMGHVREAIGVLQVADRLLSPTEEDRYW